MAKILVTPRSVTKGGHPALAPLTDAGHELIFCTPGVLPTEEELRRLVSGCTGYLAGVEKITAAVLEAASDLVVIARNGTGVDSIDLEAAARLDIKVFPAAGANARGVAELTLGLMLGLVRAIPLSDHALKRGDWERRKGMELQGNTLGIVGCGNIGRLVAGFALAFGMDVLAFDVMPDATFSPAGSFRYAPLDEVLQAADIVTLHCPPTDRPLLDAAAIAAMRDGVYVINTARADVIDAQALLAALNSGKVAGAALDVFEGLADDPAGLMQHERVIATPHIGAFTGESSGRAVEVAVANLLNHLK